MVFSSLTFLFVFLPIVLLIYYISPKPLKNFATSQKNLNFWHSKKWWGNSDHLKKNEKFQWEIFIDSFKMEKDQILKN